MAGEKILIVEDDQQVRTLSERILQRAGYQTLMATDGLAGLDIADSTNIDAVVSDIEMPRLNGVEAAVRIQLTKPEVPVLLMSGNMNAINQYRASHPQFRYLGKPWTGPVLLEEVAALLAAKTYR